MNKLIGVLLICASIATFYGMFYVFHLMNNFPIDSWYLFPTGFATLVLGILGVGTFAMVGFELIFND